MTKKNIKKTAGNVAKGTGTVLLAVLEIAGSAAEEKQKREMQDFRDKYLGGHTYEEALEAIFDESGMFDSDIKKIVPQVKRGKSSDYYAGIIKIAKSDMFSSSKRSLIEQMCK